MHRRRRESWFSNLTAGDIPFRKDMTFEYGVADQVAPLVRRVVARNPGHYTLHGTNTYIVGRGRVAVIDPGPLMEDHIAALIAAVEGEEVENIIVTHTHHDHSPAARPLQEAVGGVISGALPKPVPEGAKTTESIHREFVPDRKLVDGDSFSGDGWTLEAVHTPGHMSNHMCLALAEQGILFTGDHIMGWNTTVVSPPDGSMRDYMGSLERCLARNDRTYWPAHGPAINDPMPFVRAYRTHRRMREGEILRCIETGAVTLPAMVETMYQHIPAVMHHAAARSVLAHLEHMVETGRVAADGAVTPEAVFSLA